MDFGQTTHTSKEANKSKEMTKNSSETRKKVSQKHTIGWFSDCSTPTANELIYFTQIIVIFTVVITSLYNLCVQSGDDSLWTALLTSCLGYILPNPKLKNRATNQEINTSV